MQTWWFIDGSTFKSDNLWIDGVQGVPLRDGITLGGGSVGQVVRNAHFNPHYAVQLRLQEVRSEGRDVDYWGIVNNNLEPLVFMKTQNAFLFHRFVFGSKNGLVLRPSANGRGASDVVVGYSTDGSPIALTSEGTALVNEVHLSFNLSNSILRKMEKGIYSFAMAFSLQNSLLRSIFKRRILFLINPYSIPMRAPFLF